MYQRVVGITKTAAGNLTLGDISSALGSGGDFVVKSMTGWGIPSDVGQIYGNSSFIAHGSSLMTGASAQDDVSVQDSGSSDARPAVRFNVPPSRATWFNRDTASTVVAAECSTAALWHVQVLQFVA